MNMLVRTFSDDFQPTLAALKSNLRITSSDFDADLLGKLKASILSAEHFIGRVIGKSTFTFTSGFAQSVRLRTPLISLESVSVGGVVLTSDKYSVDSSGLLMISDDYTEGEISVVYVSGMTYVPEDIVAAILLHASALFSNPVDSVELLQKVSDNLLSRYRRWGISDDE